MGKVKTFIDNPVYFITSPAAKGWLNWVPDSLYLKVLYKASVHRRLNLKHPECYNEKLQWLKVNDRKPEYARMVDKYEVRSYITELLGEEYLIPCLGIYDSVDEIEYSRLPDRFVMKCTHDSGSVEICTDKDSFDFESAKNRLAYACKRNYYDTYREWPYKYVKPRIIIEQYMQDEETRDLRDYKIMCFNGQAKIVETHENRFVEGREHTQTFYDRDWNILNLVQVGLNPVKEVGKRPKQLDEILRMSEIIAKGMYHARVDWYIINGRIYFGEITFYDGSGFDSFATLEMEKWLGSLIELPCDHNMRR